MKISNLLLAGSTAILVSACGGSSGGSTELAADEDSTLLVNAPLPSAAEPEAEQGDLLTGRFVDSPVAGLQYETPTQSGVTGSDGSFDYLAGESITFSIGDIVLPTIAAENVITPLSVFSTTTITDTDVMNLARLLQTLDADSNLSNGITITEAANASAAGLSVDFSSPDFDSQVVNLIANSGTNSTELVAGIDALEHLQESLFIEGIDERPPSIAETQEETPATPDAGNSAVNPAVGVSAEFSNFAHDIGGTLTVLDDRTIQITNFSYDGGGVVVFFYNGVDGDYTNGQPIGPQLNGTRFENETITLTIPDNLTLDDFNGISVWCVPFAANFGDAQF